MTQSFRFLRSAVALGVLAACAGSALAQSTTITFQNATPPITIPLRDGSAVNIDGSGNLTAQCELSPQNGCVGATAGGSKAEVLTFQRTDTDASVTVGESVTLSWTSANATICNATSSPALAAWTGVKTATGAGVSVAFAAQGSHELTLTCYNDSGSAGARAVTVSVGAAPGGGTPDAENCTNIAPHSLVKPTGFQMHELAWPLAFYNNEYPSSGSPLAPLGSFTLKSSGNTGPAIAGRYISVPFKPSTGTYLLNWLQAQPIPDYRYGPSRPALLVYATISTCRGDFRLADPSSSDPLLKSACRKISGSTSIYYSGTSTGYNTCAVEVGKQYYMNFLFADPRDGLTTTENTCGGGDDQCEVNVRHERQSQ